MLGGLLAVLERREQPAVVVIDWVAYIALCDVRGL